jgi:hypothetical protein
MAAQPELARIVLFTQKKEVPELMKALSIAFEGKFMFGTVEKNEEKVFPPRLL